MIRSSLEIVPDCRSCLNVDNLISELALRQEAYAKIYDSYDRRSEAMSSEEGLAYIRLQDSLLDALEQATFCKGRIIGICGLEKLRL